MGQDISIKNFSVSPLRAPLIQPFRTALGEHKELENILFEFELSNGIKGQGEAAVATHITGETLEETNKNLNLIGQSLIGREIGDYLEISAELHERLSVNKCALAAVECALVDSLTQSRKIPLWKFCGTICRPLKTDITIVIADLEETQETVKKFYKQGFRAFKVKIGRDFDLDIKRVVAVDKLAPRSQIYLDANQGYSAEEILKFLEVLKKYKVTIDLLEQPVPRADWEGLRKVTRETDIAVCADESVRSLSEAVQIIKEKAADVINIKLMKFGFFHAREIALIARANNVDLMIGGMMETSLAMTAAAHLAAGMGCFKYIDLDTPFFLKEGYDKNPYLSKRGVYNLQKVKKGIGL